MPQCKQGQLMLELGANGLGVFLFHMEKKKGKAYSKTLGNQGSESNGQETCVEVNSEIKENPDSSTRPFPGAFSSSLASSSHLWDLCSR